MRQMKWTMLFLCFAMMITLVSCGDYGAEKSTYESSSKQTEEIFSSEERELSENQNFWKMFRICVIL